MIWDSMSTTGSRRGLTECGQSAIGGTSSLGRFGFGPGHRAAPADDQLGGEPVVSIGFYLPLSRKPLRRLWLEAGKQRVLFRDRISLQRGRCEAMAALPDFRQIRISASSVPRDRTSVLLKRSRRTCGKRHAHCRQAKGPTDQFVRLHREQHKIHPLEETLQYRARNIRKDFEGA